MADARDGTGQDQPNILVIMTDQQSGESLGCLRRDGHLHTPHMDALVADGTRFTRAYAVNPLCLPMRTCMMTGRYPHEIGVLTNGDRLHTPEAHTFLGKVFRDAGYTTAYFGKWHVPLSGSRNDLHGFDTFEPDAPQLDPSHIADFLTADPACPFLAVASFLTPHEICEWARKERIPGAPLDDVPPIEARPPLRANAAPPEDETDTMRHMRKSYQAARMFPVGAYTEADWRRLRWGYDRLVERADGFVGAVMDALHASGHARDTIVVFLSDHGDCQGAHGWNQKTVFYEESACVPFVICHAGRTSGTTSNTLLNAGVDLMPTLCGLAGIDPPAGLPGRSVHEAVYGGTPAEARDVVVAQHRMVQGEPVDGLHWQPDGRMVRSARYKYCVYSEGEHRESLVDLEADPGELHNRARDPAFADILAQHRNHLATFATERNDTTGHDLL